MANEMEKLLADMERDTERMMWPEHKRRLLPLLEADDALYEWAKLMKNGNFERCQYDAAKAKALGGKP